MHFRLRDYQAKAIDDIRRAFNEGARRVCYVAPCGAGKGHLVAYMANQAAANGRQVLFLVHRQELLDQVAESIGRPHELITLVSVQAAARRLDRLAPPDLIISDEFHHATAATWRKVFDHFPTAHLVGLTATPARLGGQGLREVCDELIVGLSVKELIAAGYLAPFKYFAPPPVADLTGLKIKMGDYDAQEIAIRLDIPAILGDCLGHYQKLADGKNAIIYCASIRHSQNVAAGFAAAGYTAKHIDGATPKAERKQAIADFKAGRLRILTNVDLFGEGLDCPGAEVVILLRPTASLTLYIQQSMRGMRPAPGKTSIILDHVGNCHRHGLPDEDRTWNLDGLKKRHLDPGTVLIKRCPMCYMVSKPAPVCPYCQFEYVATRRDLAQTVGELAEITVVEQRDRRMEVGQCRTLADLKKIAQERGYKPAWVRTMARIKNIRG